jgi:SAM-dependent methyltransferase
MTDISDYTQQNRRAWNEIAEVRHKKQQPAEFFAKGGSTLEAKELGVAGNLTRSTLLHLQCATGEDTLSWAVAGAQATGVDISDKQIALAQRKAVDAGLAVRFVAADIYSLPNDLQSATFDFVYTGGGAILWLPDLNRWAKVIVAALKPGGKLIVYEAHPLIQCLEVRDGKLHLDSDYFSRDKPAYEGAGWNHFAGGEDAIEKKFEFNWPLGEIVTALARAGMRIESLEEFPYDGYWCYGALENAQRLPGDFLLVARKNNALTTMP